MSKLKSIALAIAIVMIPLMGIIVGDTYAFEIERIYPSSGGHYIYSGWLYNTACVETDEPYSDVWWYINGEYVGWSSSHVDNPKTTAYFYPIDTNYPGSPHGKQYRIEAVAQSFMDENGNIEQDTAFYDVYVYSLPKKDSKYGDHTFAYMKGSVDVGWNGTKAETKADGYISTEMPLSIAYGINIRYAVGRLTRGDPEILDQPAPPLPINIGVISKGHQFFPPNASQLYSDSYELHNGGNPGSTYYVEAKVTITAQYPQFPNKQDMLIVEDREELSIPDAPLN